MRNFVLLANEEDLSPFTPFKAQRELKVVACLLDLAEDLLLRLAHALVTLDDHSHPLQGAQVRLVLDEVLDSRIVVADQNGVILPHHVRADLLVDRLLKNLVDFDLVDHVVVLAQVDHQADEDVYHHQQEDHR